MKKAWKSVLIGVSVVAAFVGGWVASGAIGGLMPPVNPILEQDPAKYGPDEMAALDASEKFWTAMEAADEAGMREVCAPNCTFVHIGMTCKLDDEIRFYTDGIFVPTKLFPCSYKQADKEIDATLKRLDTDYIDLLLLHQPYGDVKNAWQALERAFKDGKVRSIGVSNFEPKDLKKLLSYAAVKPALLQCECHPYHAMDEMRKELPIEAWHPLGHGDAGLLSEPVFGELGQKYGKTPAQIVLRWHIQKGNVVIPGSRNPAHIRENFEIFDFSLTDEEMQEIAKLDGKKKFFKMPAPMALAMPMMKMDFDAQK